MKTCRLLASLGVLTLFLDFATQEAITGTKFSLIDEDSSNDLPSIVVTFPDGHADRLMLRKHYFNEEDRMASKDECHYTGHLAHEKDACVSMTGCIGSEDVLFTIMSKHARDSPYFLWTKEGEVNMIESGSNVKNEKDNMSAIQNPDLAMVQNPDLAMMQNPDLKFPHMRTIEEDVCYYLKPPPTAKLNIKVAIDELVYNNLDRNFTLAQSLIKRMVVHLQSHFCHPSLGTKMHINLQEVVILEGIEQTYIQFDTNMASILRDETAKMLEADSTTHLPIYLLSGHGGGEAHSDICNPSLKYPFNVQGCANNLNSVRSGILDCMHVLRHEVGHNLGMSHSSNVPDPYPNWDCGPNGNIVGGNQREEWSPCNAMDFRRIYTEREPSNWCLPEYPSACSAEETDESISFFQIQDTNGNALDATREGTHSSSVVMFTKNEFKDSQFWYLVKIPDTEYGYIGSKKYVSEDKVLTIKDDFEKPGLSLKTKCDTVSNYYKKSTKVKLEITLCQNGQCCSTGEIPPQLEECATNTYQTDELGDCSQFEFAYESMQGTVTASNLTTADLGCPNDHPYPYLNGAYCCKTNEEKTGTQSEIDSGTCDGMDFNIQSTCCKDNAWTACPWGSGCIPEGEESSEDTCADNSGSCNYWANLGYCSNIYSGYMLGNCKKSCGLCTGQWEGEWIQFMFDNGNIVECSLDGPAGGDPWRTAALNCNPIGAYFDWKKVEYKQVGNEVEDNQLWKQHGGNLVSKVSGAVLGVHETEGLTGFVGSNETITPVSVDEAATSSYELLVPDCEIDVEASPNGVFEIKNLITGKYLSMEIVEEGLYEIKVTDNNLGLHSQWSWAPRNGIEDIWGTIRPLSRPWGNPLRAKNCECPFGESKCPEQVCEVGLFGGGGMYWRKIGNQIVSKMHDGRLSPYVIGHDSEGFVMAPRGAKRAESNGEWVLTKIIPDCPIGFLHDNSSGRCYHFGSSSMNFEEAIAYCEENGGWLADIPNQESLDFLISVNPYSTHTLWIGANDIETEGTFVWVNTGNPLEFEAWKKPGEPNNYGSGEDCATMKCPQWYDHGCFWNDVPCSLKYRPICASFDASSTV